MGTHIKSKHLKIKKERTRKFKCSNCDATFLTRDHQEYHMNSVHLNLSPYKCDLCPKCFKTSLSLKAHVNQVHLKLKKHKCTHCSTAFYKKNDLEDHLKRKHLGMKFSKKWSCSNSEKNHLNNSHNPKPFVCNLCPNSQNQPYFATKTSLKAHYNHSHQNMYLAEDDK